MLYMNAIIAGIALGGVYAIIAVSITLTFRSTGVLSAAHAGFAMVGAYSYAHLIAEYGMEPWAAAAIAVLTTTALGLITERLVIRGVQDAPPTIRLIATLATMAVIQGFVILVFGTEPKLAALLLPRGQVQISSSLGISYQQLAIVAVAGMLVIGITIMLRRTRLGLSIRVVAENPQMAEHLGVSRNTIARFNWGLGGAVAGLAGLLVAPITFVTLGTFPLLLAKVFTASLFGGLVSLPLTLVGAAVVGVTESLSTVIWDAPGNREVALVVVVIALLLLRRSWPEASTAQSLVSAGAAKVPTLSARNAGVPSAVRWAMLGGGLLGAWWFASHGNYWGFVGCTILVYTIFLTSLVILVGWAGEISLMHGAFVGLGAFSTTLFVNKWGIPLALACLLGGLAGAALGTLVALPALRLKGLQLAVATLVFAGAAFSWLFNLGSLERTVGRPSFLGFDIEQDGRLFLVMLPVTVLVVLCTRNLRRSSWGAVLVAMRSSAAGVAYFGTSPIRVKLSAYALSGFLAALGGAFYALMLSSFQPKDFSPFLSITLLLFAVAGGISRVSGALLAAVIFAAGPQVLQLGPEAASSIPDIVSGALVIFLLTRRPEGLASLLSRWQSPAGLALSRHTAQPSPRAQQQPQPTPRPASEQQPSRVMS